MSKAKFPVTPAIRALRAASVDFGGHLYEYEPRGGTAASSRALGVSEHVVIKTLVLEDDRKSPLIALMHGDREVSTQALARHLGARSIAPVTPDTANKLTGYEVGGTSPFGTRRALPIYVQPSILELPLIYLNGGKRGFLVSLAPDALTRVLAPVSVEMATSPRPA